MFFPASHPAWGRISALFLDVQDEATLFKGREKARPALLSSRIALVLVM